MKSIKRLASSVFDFILFSSLFIAACAVLMVYQLAENFGIAYDFTAFYYFVFFATLTTYNFHWYLTEGFDFENNRTNWSVRNRKIHVIFFMIGLVGAIYQFFFLSQHFFAITISVLLAFFYSAPKIPISSFQYLQKIASGKTLYLSLTWVYVTSILPLLVAEQFRIEDHIYFILHRFLYIYPICILFDYRDRENDRRQGVKTFLNYFNEKSVDLVFYFSNALCVTFTTLHLSNFSFEIQQTALYIPSIVLILLYKSAKKWKSDYFFYFLLDGLMAMPVISAL